MSGRPDASKGEPARLWHPTIAVIGSRALVTRDVEPYAIVGGNPGRPIRKRFSDTEIALLLERAWWDWPIDWIEAAMPLLCTSDIAGLHAYWRGRAA